MEDGAAETTRPAFKKPVLLIGKVGKLPRKAKFEALDDVETKKEEVAVELPEESSDDDAAIAEVKPTPEVVPAKTVEVQLTSVNYKEPKWSALPPEGSGYSFEVLKSGVILEMIDLMKQPYYVFGRFANSDIVMAHPTISRHHAIFQYKATSAEDNSDSAHGNGFYVYDLGSTHGTFVNKQRVRPLHYVRVRVGHILKFGASTRQFILQGPEEDCEEQSAETITELKEKREAELTERERIMAEAIAERERKKAEDEKRAEEAGISWGMSEDAEEEQDLAENPFASSNNEELYLDDPKKTLRGFFEREGCELQYDCEERGVGQFVCRVELPIEDARGKSLVAEVVHKGKKKEAVVQCALEACRIIDRHGLLRQAKHESRRRKQRNWEEDDFYDSDDDNYLDRTGTVEKKRRERMRRHAGDAAKGDGETGGVNVALTYDDLMAIQKLKVELAKTQRLAEIAKPASLPKLVKPAEESVKTTKPANKLNVKISNSIVYGKRMRLKDDRNEKDNKTKLKKASEMINERNEEFVEEVDSEEEDESNLMHETSKRNDTVTGETEEGEKKEVKRIFGPMRPPENYVIPENYFEAESDRDLPEIMDENE